MAEANKKQIKQNSGIGSFFKKLSNLQPGLDREGTIVNIKNNKKMEGANAWLLMCSIMIASLGLDLNSTAVIIGAMLISPLMSPILGIGLGIGINDRTTLKVSLRHFGIAIGIALVTSTIYFLITPFGNYTDEINGRTMPNLLDVMVAFFGGIAGIISGSRKDKSNAIPGVAIATALMPPLCVTGYGLANIIKHGWTDGELQFVNIMSNSFYLFFMNATFVALATYLIVRFLKFPLHPFKDEKDKNRTILMMSVISILMIIPSMFILTNVLQKENKARRLDKFLKDNFKGVLNTVNRVNEDSTHIKVFRFEDVREGELEEMTTKLKNEYFLNGVSIEYVQDKDFGRAEIVEMIRKEEKEMKTNLNNIVENKNATIEYLSSKLDSLTSIELQTKRVEDELISLYPELGEIQFYPSVDEKHPLIIAQKSEEVIESEILPRINRYLRTRLGVDTTVVVLK